MTLREMARMFALNETAPPAGDEGGGGDGTELTADEKIALHEKRLGGEIKKAKERARAAEDRIQKLEPVSAFLATLATSGIKLEELPDLFKALKTLKAPNGGEHRPPAPAGETDQQLHESSGADRLKIMELERTVKDAVEKQDRAEKRAAEATRKAQEKERDAMLMQAMEGAGVLDEMRNVLLPTLQRATRIEGDGDDWKVYAKWKDPKGEEFDTPLEENPAGVVKSLLPLMAFKPTGGPGSGKGGPGSLDKVGTSDVINKALDSQAYFEANKDKVDATERREGLVKQ